MEKVYILECNWFHKIWYTNQEAVEKRVDNMKTWNPFPINILKVYECEVWTWTKKEKQLHNFFQHKNHQLEWFKLNKWDFLQIDRLMWIDLVEREIKDRRDKLNEEIRNLNIRKTSLENRISELSGNSLKNTETNHIKIEDKKINLKKVKLSSWKEALSWETKFASKEYFVNVYFNDWYYTLTFKRKKNVF
jgi:hypothetical protein